jgi:hypothetical protein
LKKTALVLVVFALAILIVLPTPRSVNQSGDHSLAIQRNLRADGDPRPLPLPPNLTNMGTGVLVAGRGSAAIPLTLNSVMLEV